MLGLLDSLLKLIGKPLRIALEWLNNTKVTPFGMVIFTVVLAIIAWIMYILT